MDFTTIYYYDLGMLHPRSAPKLYRQDDIWHVRIYVPKTVIKLVGSNEIHRTTSQTVRTAALKAAEAIRAEMYVWFNELNDRATQDTQQVSDLADAEIADMARKVYLNYREEIDIEMAELFRLSSDDHDAATIAEDEKSPLLRSMLADFDLQDAADVNARMMLKQRGLTLVPDAPAYTKLLRRIREALTQVHVDAVNLYANTPAKRDNPFFIDPATQEPKQPLSASSPPIRGRTLDTLIPMVLEEVEAARDYKGIEKIKHTLRLMSEFLGVASEIGCIDRQGVLAFRNAFEKLPTNAAKRYPKLSILQVIESRSPEHLTISVSHINGHLRNIRQFFRACARNDSTFVIPNLERLDLIDPVNAIDTRYPFSTERLAKLFNATLTDVSLHKSPFMVWACAIGLFYGFRANEIATL